MVTIENDCVGCEGPYRRCAYCSLSESKVYYCDACGEEIERGDVYKVDDNHYCRDCLLETFKHNEDED